MPCGPSLIDLWGSGRFFDAVTCPFIDAVGKYAFPLIVLGGIGAALYIVSDSVVPPFVVAIIFGGVLVSQLPGIALQVVGIALLMIFAGVGLRLVTRL